MTDTHCLLGATGAADAAALAGRGNRICLLAPLRLHYPDCIKGAEGFAEPATETSRLIYLGNRGQYVYVAFRHRRSGPRYCGPGLGNSLINILRGLGRRGETDA